MLPRCALGSLGSLRRALLSSIPRQWVVVYYCRTAVGTSSRIGRNQGGKSDGPALRGAELA